MAAPEDRPVPYPNIMHGIGGHLSRIEANFLYDTPGRMGDGIYGDLGTFEGRSAICMAGGIKDTGVNAHILTVDAYDGRNMTRSRPHLMEDVVDSFKEKGVANYVTFLKGLTTPTADKCRSQRFNFLFIDADHSYEGCKADFEAWGPLVKPGGEIAFHDSNLDSVIRVLDEIPWETYVIDTITVKVKP